MAALLVLLGLAAVASTEWLRHRPQRLAQGTQHLARVGDTVAALLLGEVSWLLLAG